MLVYVRSGSSLTEKKRRTSESKRPPSFQNVSQLRTREEGREIQWGTAFEETVLTNEAAPKSSKKEKTMHILVVEDEQRLAYLLRRVLLEERHTVDLAHDGHTGLNLALSDTYDVVVLDVMLPGIDGLELCRQMRA